MWEHRGGKRPDFAAEPESHQESVWDYPRPPALVPCQKRVIVTHGDRVVADSSNAVRVLETASPPSVYIPASDADLSQLMDASGRSYCEWKGHASYYSLTEGGQIVAWEYGDPTREFLGIKHFLSFYPGRVACSMDGEVVRAQAGEFYGGWVTDDIAGPFKGDQGTGHW